MAVQVRYITASSVSALEKEVNTFLAEVTSDARNIVQVITSFGDADNGYVAVVQCSAPHLRTFED